MYIQTLKTKFRFSVDGKPEVRKKVKEYLDKNRIKYAYFCRIKMFSVDIAAKDQIMQLLKTLK